MKLDYYVLGTNNLEKSIKFYDSQLEQTEFNKVLSNDGMTYWQCNIAKPFNVEPASNGNEIMIGLNVGSTEEVKRLHIKAVELGVTCEDKPAQGGLKYSTYVRDSDKN